MVKKILLLILCLLSLIATQGKAADIEARSGIMGGDAWGVQTGAYINFQRSSLFSIQTGVLLHTAESGSFLNSNSWNINMNIPVYASFHLPVSEKVNVRLNAGAYVGTGDYVHLGVTGEAGLEIKRFYVGVNCFQNCVNNTDLQLGLSVAYNFSL